MKKIFLSAVLALAATGLMAQTTSTTTTTMATGKNGKPLPSPRMLTTAQVGKAKIDIDYGAPSVKGRNVFFDVVKQDKIWRTGANEATGFKTSGALMVGSLHVPAGSYTLYTMPTASGWWLVVNKQTGQWGLTYDEKQDLGRVKLTSSTMPSSQEVFSISIEKIKGNHAELHIKWDKTDLSTPIMAH